MALYLDSVVTKNTFRDRLNDFFNFIHILVQYFYFMQYEKCFPNTHFFFRLLHWASKQIDPVGVDYVLQKLGFTHARQTIPKWMQRGFMDPSDKIISMLVNKLIVFLRENPEARQ